MNNPFNSTAGKGPHEVVTEEEEEMMDDES